MFWLRHLQMWAVAFPTHSPTAFRKVFEHRDDDHTTPSTLMLPTHSTIHRQCLKSIAHYPL